MVKTDTSLWSFFKKSMATGLVLLLTMVGLVPVAEAGTWIRRDWSKVQQIAPGTRTKVRLYKDRAPGGIYKIEGRFNSATPEAIMLSLSGGKIHTLQKQDVTKVLVYRPLAKRYPGWITLGVSTGISIPTVQRWGSDVVPSGKLFFSSLFIGGPTILAFLVAPRWGGVYNVPRSLRDDVAPTALPSGDKENSSTPVSGTKGASIAPPGAGSGDRFLNGTSDPEWLRLQARRAVMRQDLPLDLSSLPGPAPRSGID